MDKADAVELGNDVEECVFGTVDLDKCKVVTRASRFNEESATATWIEQVWSNLEATEVFAMPSKPTTELVGAGTKNGVGSKLIFALCWQEDPMIICEKRV